MGLHSDQQQLDWQSSRSVIECNRYMLENHIDCDVKFLLQAPDGSQVRLAAHKYVLLSRSPVFYAMFRGPLAERGPDVQIYDVLPETFKLLLR